MNVFRLALGGVLVACGAVVCVIPVLPGPLLSFVDFVYCRLAKHTPGNAFARPPGSVREWAEGLLVELDEFKQNMPGHPEGEIDALAERVRTHIDDR